MKSSSNVAKLSDSKLQQLFPEAACGVKPLGQRIVVQLRRLPTKVGSILLAEYSKEVERDTQQVAKVIALGPVAFKNRQTLAEWPEGPWVQPGQYVRVPRYGGDRWDVQDSSGTVTFAVFNDHEVISVLDGADPTTMIGYV